ncbi:MAG: bifunctional riboflavin kinase/FAD synthetase [Flavobacteriales bacterium]|nr:bifunctional riboflavin kinase/FAD synthetase [Flavobacteriales bacterium]
MKIYRGFDQIDDVITPSVVTIGTFDGVHRAHRMLIDAVNSMAKNIHGRSVVVTFEPHPRSFFSTETAPRLLTSTEEKAAILEQARVDVLVIQTFDKDFAALTAEEFFSSLLIKKLNTKAMVVGYDHSFGSERANAYDFLKKHHVDTAIIPQINHKGITISSSSIRRALEGGDITLANELLGRPYSFSGPVVHGKQLGRTLGYPTANILLDQKHKLLPPDGVYAVKVHLNGETFGGMMNCGMRPTLDDKLGRSIEVNIFDFSKDIYGENLNVEIMSWVRSEVKFNCLDSLVSQLKNDAETCRRILEKKQ